MIGNIRAQEDVSLKQTGEVRGDIIAGGNVDLQQDAEGVSGDIVAGGDVTLTQDAVVSGNVIAGGNVTLSQAAKVEGYVTAGGTVTVNHSAVILGSITESATIAGIPALELVSANPTGDGNVNIVTTNLPTISGNASTGYLLA
jgi:adhesin HecA-like repeat protein